jgi:hypothetical protein
VVNNGGVLDIQREAYFTGYKSLTVFNGGKLTNDGPQMYIYSKTLIKSGGTLHNKGFGRIINKNDLIVEPGGIFINEGNYSGTGTYEGNFVNSGVLAPGNSPGIISLTGDYSPTSTATHNFEVGGVAASQYDILNVSGNVNLNGTLNISLINGFTPSTSHELPIITGNIIGTFSTVNIPSSYLLVYNANGVVLKSAIVLPVNFKVFYAKKINNSIALHWQIDSEENISKYEIETSKDGRSFTYTGSVTANKQSDYYFNDIIREGKTYYRIKSIDKDHNFKYSSIINYSNVESKVVLKALLQKNKIVIQHPDSDKTGHIAIISVDGKIIKNVVIQKGSQQTSIDFSNLSKGVYFITYTEGNQIETVSILKQ